MLLEFADRNGTFSTINGNGWVYGAARYSETGLTLIATTQAVVPLTLAGFSGNEQVETFSPNFGRQNSPVTFNGITYTSLAGGQLWSDINWSNNGYYSIWPTASGTTGLNDLVGLTRLRIELHDSRQPRRDLRQPGLDLHDDGLR